MQKVATLVTISHFGIAALGPDANWISSDNKEETNWVIVDARTGAPRAPGKPVKYSTFRRK